MPELYAVTSGDPAGIGPDISLKIALREDSHQFVVFGNMDLLRERAEMHAMDIKFIDETIEFLLREKLVIEKTLLRRMEYFLKKSLLKKKLVIY